MFTIKATYRGETRKLSFPECDTFPSFDQICSHLCRVFPVSHNYFLSKLLFSMNASQSPRVLIGREVHTTDDYNNCIQPYQYRTWPTGLLRFTILDGNADGENQTPIYSANIDKGYSSSNTPLTWTLPSEARNIPTSLSAFPPLPTLYSLSPFLSIQKSVGNDGHHSSKGKSSTEACCSAANVKLEVETLISKFQHDLGHTLTEAFGVSSFSSTVPKEQGPKSAPTPELTANSSTGTVSSVCSTCASRQSVAWYSCDKCRIISCSGCKGSMSNNGFCMASMGSHSMRIGLPSNQIPFATNNSTQGLSIWGPSVPHVQTSGYPSWSPIATGFSAVNNLVSSPVAHARQEPSTPAFVPFIPPAVSPEPSPRLTPLQTSPAHVRNPPIPEPLSSPSVIHNGVVCDSCNATIQGVRHKCLECADYDLCSACISSGSAESHNPFHEFFEIAEPSRTIVHTVFEGDQTSANIPGGLQPSVCEPANHPATCNLCDSRIQGDRYKCLECPDFDACAACYSITDDQHPHHAFVKVSNPSDFIVDAEGDRDQCTLRLATYAMPLFWKSLQDCPDFDLCAGCEAHPISVHPDNHPLLKMRNPDTVIPTVYRVGETQLIEQPAVSEDARNAPLLNIHDVSTPLVSEPDSPAPSPPSPFYFSDDYQLKSQPVIDTPSEFQRERSPSPGVPSVSIMEGFYTSADEQWGFKSPPMLPLTASDGGCNSRTTLDDPLLEWRRSSTELGHLMQDHANVGAGVLSDRPTSVAAPTEIDIGVVNSPSTEKEVLLNRPTSTPPEMQERRSSGIPGLINAFSLATLLHGDQAAVDESFFTPKSISENKQLFDEPEFNAAFVSDVTVSDGQVFPPGAEFVKCWRMANSGEEDWDEGTELVFVGGSALGSDKAAVKVGTVKAGTETDVSTGELKAPDTPGKYVGYWRLRDGNGRLFGDGIWVEIEVVEVGQYSDESLASSTIIMPGGAQTSEVQTTLGSSVSGPSGQATDFGSDESSISLLSGGLSDEDDEQLWEDSRRTVAQDEQGSEYVLLYDDPSTSEEE
ncbi:hypothetical protein BDQ17DRAFT_1418717 [Cyathus striatus]|nr:hypothetical protein BDQ17DRAFT_1418717 [Cyathus striatus]